MATAPAAPPAIHVAMAVLSTALAFSANVRVTTGLGVFLYEAGPPANPAFNAAAPPATKPSTPAVAAPVTITHGESGGGFKRRATSLSTPRVTPFLSGTSGKSSATAGPMAPSS